MPTLISAIPGAMARAKFMQADVGVKSQIKGVVHEATKLFGGGVVA
jgi:hypothetical protein